MTEVPHSITRVMLIKPDSAIAYEVFADEWDIYVQDDGRTLKLRAKGSGAEAARARSAALGEDLGKFSSPRVREQDIRVDIYSSGPLHRVANQSVRITHIPTGKVITTEGTKSQMRLKAQAIDQLEAYLVEREWVPPDGD